MPEGAELAILETVRDKVPPEVFTTAYTNPVSDSPDAVRNNLREATRLLREAGYEVRDRKLVNAKTGEPLTVEVLIDRPEWERIVLPYKPSLERLGIQMTLRIVDDAQYENRLRQWDYDMIVGVLGPVAVARQRAARLSGARKAADQAGSRNYVGIKNPAVDALIERLIFAKSRADLVAATKALDRVLLWNHYVVPQWTYGKVRSARWDRFGRPDPLPKYGFSGFPDGLVVGRRPRRRRWDRARDRTVAPRRSRHRRRRRCQPARLDATAQAQPADDAERHGMSSFGDLKYPADFPHFDYVDPEGAQGRRVLADRPGHDLQSEPPDLQFAQQLHPARRRGAGHGADLREPDGAGRRRAGCDVRARRARGPHLRRRPDLSLRAAARGALPRRQPADRA